MYVFIRISLPQEYTYRTDYNTKQKMQNAIITQLEEQ